mgnify:CR=1 FL=1
MTEQIQSLASSDPEVQLAVLRKSRLSDLIEDKVLREQIYEAGIQLLTSEALRACDPETILGALYKAVSMKFRLAPEFGEVFLIPRSITVGKDKDGKWIKKQVCCFQIGYKGWRALALQSGNLSYLESREVYVEDDFSFEYGTSAYLRHSPTTGKKTDMTHFYSMAKGRDGSVVFHVITKDEAEKTRRLSESQYVKIGQYPNQVKEFSKDAIGFWEKGYATMALRGPIKAVCSFIPLTPSLQAGIDADGGVTYLNADGKIKNLSPIEVLKAEEPLPTEEKNTGLAPELAEKFLETKDVLANMDFYAVLSFYEGWKTGDLKDNRLFLELFFDRVAASAEHTDNLNQFYSASGKWGKDPIFYKKLSDAKERIEKNGN